MRGSQLLKFFSAAQGLGAAIFILLNVYPNTLSAQTTTCKKEDKPGLCGAYDADVEYRSCLLDQAKKDSTEAERARRAYDGAVQAQGVCQAKWSTRDADTCEEYRKDIRKSKDDVDKKCTRAIRSSGTSFTCATALARCRSDYEEDLQTRNGIPIFQYASDDPEDACKRGLMGGRAKQLEDSISKADKKVTEATDRLDKLREELKDVNDTATDGINQAYEDIANASEDADVKTAKLLGDSEEMAAKGEAQDTGLALEIRDLQDKRDALLSQAPVTAQTKLISSINRTRQKCAEEAKKTIAAENQRRLFRKRNGPGSLLGDATGAEKAQLINLHRALVRECSNVENVDAENMYNLELRGINSQLQNLETALRAKQLLQLQMRQGSERQKQVMKQQLQSIQTTLETKRVQLLGKIQSLQAKKQLDNARVNGEIAKETMKLRQQEERLLLAETSYANIGGADGKDYDNFMDALSSAQSYDRLVTEAKDLCCKNSSTYDVLGTAICGPKPTTPAKVPASTTTVPSNTGGSDTGGTNTGGKGSSRYGCSGSSQDTCPP